MADATSSGGCICNTSLIRSGIRIDISVKMLRPPQHEVTRREPKSFRAGGVREHRQVLRVCYQRGSGGGWLLPSMARLPVVLHLAPAVAAFARE